MILCALLHYAEARPLRDTSNSDYMVEISPFETQLTMTRLLAVAVDMINMIRPLGSTNCNSDDILHHLTDISFCETGAL